MNCIQPRAPGGGDVEVGAEGGLDAVDRGEHLPRHSVLGAARLVDRKQERRDRELVDDEVRDADRGGPEVGDRQPGVRVRRRAVGVAVLGALHRLAVVGDAARVGLVVVRSAGLTPSPRPPEPLGPGSPPPGPTVPPGAPPPPPPPPLPPLGGSTGSGAGSGSGAGAPENRTPLRRAAPCSRDPRRSVRPSPSSSARLEHWGSVSSWLEVLAVGEVDLDAALADADSAALARCRAHGDAPSGEGESDRQ